MNDNIGRDINSDNLGDDANTIKRSCYIELGRIYAYIPVRYNHSVVLNYLGGTFRGNKNTVWGHGKDQVATSNSHNNLTPIPIKLG